MTVLRKVGVVGAAFALVGAVVGHVPGAPEFAALTGVGFGALAMWITGLEVA